MTGECWLCNILFVLNKQSIIKWMKITVSLSPVYKSNSKTYVSKVRKQGISKWSHIVILKYIH